MAICVVGLGLTVGLLCPAFAVLPLRGATDHAFCRAGVGGSREALGRLRSARRLSTSAMPPRPDGARRIGTLFSIAAALAVAVAVLPLTTARAAGAATLAAPPSGAGVSSTAPPDSALSGLAQSAAQAAVTRGYRTGVAVLDLSTGTYAGAGADTAPFASESVVKVMIVSRLLLTGQMTGAVADEAYRMITQSDDADADALYGPAGGDALIEETAAHYGIRFLGSPPRSPGWWGSTQITAKGMVYLYAAIAQDPVVGPWLMNAMAHATEYGADGTYQFFGLPSAAPAAAVKQGWGDDGDDTPNAVFNSTGYVGGTTAGGATDDRYAVAILTDGPPDSYGNAISGVLTAQAQALMPGGRIDDPATHDPALSHVTVTAEGNTVTVHGSATDPDAGSGPVQVVLREGGTVIAAAPADAAHHVSLAVHAADGGHDYTLTALNVGEGTTDATVTLPTVQVDGDPTGTVTAVTGGAGTATITGSETDPDARAGSTPTLTVQIDGGPPRAASAGRRVLAGGANVVDVVVPAPAGSHQITIRWRGSDGAADTVAGTWPVTVRPSALQAHVAAAEHAGLDFGGAAGVLSVIVLPWRRRRRNRVGRRRDPRRLTI